MMAEQRRHVLCIGDDRDTLALIAEALADRGFDTSLAYDGEEGFRAIMARSPDVVLADTRMPIPSGVELLERLNRVTPRFNRMPFLFLTTFSDRSDELRLRQLGADDYIVKPIDFDILAAIITARLAGVARNAVWSKQVELTEREAETLTWAARGKTSAEIARILGVTKRTVDFHVDNARTKLGAATRMHAAVKAAAAQLIAL